MSSNPYNYMDYRDADHKMADQGCVWLFDHTFKVLWPQATPTVYSLYARSVCNTIAPLQLHLPPVALYNCYALPFYFIFFNLTKKYNDNSTDNNLYYVLQVLDVRPLRRYKFLDGLVHVESRR